MFDVGFWELTLVGLVGLLVIGPRRLPSVVRVMGFWLGKAQRTVASVKQEIKAELYAEDLRQTLAKKPPVEEIRNFIEETSTLLDEAPPTARTNEAAPSVEKKPGPAE